MRTFKVVIDVGDSYRYYCDYLNSVEMQEVEFLEDMFFKILSHCYTPGPDIKLSIFEILTEILTVDQVFELIDIVAQLSRDSIIAAIGTRLTRVSVSIYSPTSLIVEVAN